MMKKVNPTSNEYGFYSKKLQKPFDTLEELLKAEEAAELEARAKAEAAAAKKADATKVEEAFKKVNEAKKIMNETIDVASKAYAEEMKAAKDKYIATVDQAEVAYLAAEKEYKEKLSEFSKAHGNFHMTLKDGDVVSTVSRQQSSEVDPATEFLKSILRMLKA
jgi:hypothetical protein